MKTSTLLVLSFAAASLLAGQEKKPADPKAPAATPEQTTANTAKTDARNNETLKKGKAMLDKALHRSEAAQKEAERIEKSKKNAAVDEGKAKLEEVKKKIDPKDLKDFKDLVKEGVKEGTKAIRDRNKKDDTGPPESTPAVEPDSTPGSFDNTSKQEEALPVRKSPVFQNAPLSADLMVSGMVKDPLHPKVDLPKSDPRTRTFVLNGNARLRRPDFVVDADEVEILAKEGRSPGSTGKSNKATASADPVKPGGAKSAPIERMVARGRVRFMFVDKEGHVQAGRCGYLIYEEKSGWFILKDWPEAEAEGYLLRGPRKDSVIRLSRTEKADAAGCELIPLDRDLTAGDVPKDKETPVPAARPARSKTSAPLP